MGVNSQSKMILYIRLDVKVEKKNTYLRETKKISLLIHWPTFGHGQVFVYAWMKLEIKPPQPHVLTRMAAAIAVVYLSLLLLLLHGAAPAVLGYTRGDFPEDFVFGSATSSYQVVASSNSRSFGWSEIFLAISWFLFSFENFYWAL